jgi:hypothetical protein
MGHVTYTSKQRCLTTKNVLLADNCSHLHLSFFGFERTFYYVSNWHFLCFERSIKSWLLNNRWVSVSAYCFFSVSTNAQFEKFLKDLLDSAGVLFASNDSKTSFEQRKNARWTNNWDDSLKTNIWPQRTIFRPQQSNFVCSNDKFVGDMAQCLSKLAGNINSDSFSANPSKSGIECTLGGCRWWLNKRWAPTLFYSSFIMKELGPCSYMATGQLLGGVWQKSSTPF